eukprot:9487154-Pyramimonas_sp.AAC.1
MEYPKRRKVVRNLSSTAAGARCPSGCRASSGSQCIRACAKAECQCRRSPPPNELAAWPPLSGRRNARGVGYPRPSRE